MLNYTPEYAINNITSKIIIYDIHKDQVSGLHENIIYNIVNIEDIKLNGYYKPLYRGFQTCYGIFCPVTVTNFIVIDFDDISFDYSVLYEYIYIIKRFFGIKNIEYDILLTSIDGCDHSFHLYVNLKNHYNTLEFYNTINDNIIANKHCKGFIEGITDSGVMTIRISEKFHRNDYNSFAPILIENGTVNDNITVNKSYKEKIQSFIKDSKFYSFVENKIKFISR